MRSLNLAIPLLCVAGLAAQQVTVPSNALVGPPIYNLSGWWSSNVFYSTTTAGANQSHTQLIYATSDISAPVAVWTSVSVRRPGKATTSYLGNNNPAMTTNAVITMSMSPGNWNDTTTNYAANHGTSVVTVFNSTISLPAQASQNIWPFPYEMAIPFSTPFTYVGAAGNTVVFDILQTGNSATTPWYVEAYNRDVGSRTENGGYLSTCKFSNGATNNSIGYNLPYVGGNWTLNYQGGLPASLVAVGALGGTGVGGSWAGLPLPIDLAPFGAPGCKWNVSIDLTSPLTPAGSGMNLYQWPNIPVPNNPGIVGAKFYDQGFFIDPGANAWGVVSSWSSTWTVGSNIGSMARQVSTVGAAATTAISGSTTPGFGVTLQFN